MKVQSLLIAAVAVILATTAQAQVKVGSNPGTLSTNAVLDVEGTGGNHSVILQNGNMGVGTVTPQNTLHVNGTTQISGPLQAGGSATAAGNAGTSGQVLTSSGSGSAPTWQTPVITPGASASLVGGATKAGSYFNVTNTATTTVPNSTYTFTIPSAGKALFLNYMLGLDQTNVPTGGGAAYYEADIYVDGSPSGIYLINQEPQAYNGSANTGGQQMSFSMGGVLQLSGGTHTIDVRMIRTANNGIASGTAQQFLTLSNNFSAAYLN